MKNLLRKHVTIQLVVLAVVFLGGGCDFFYRLVQKEGAEERDIIGEVSPFEKNDKVAEVQQLLKIYGYRVGRADGILGATTRDAIEQFQVDNNLTTSRFVDKATWARLIELEQDGLVDNGKIVVKAVQQALKEAGCQPGKIDGKMGQATKAAIIEFQKKNNLNPDGKVGYQTLRRLAEYLPPFTDEEDGVVEIQEKKEPPVVKKTSKKKSRAK